MSPVSAPPAPATAPRPALVPDRDVASRPARPPLAERAPVAPPRTGQLSPAQRDALVRTVGVGVATLSALPFSLALLVSDFRYAAALGEIALIPVCALVLALVAAWRHPWVSQLRPGRADWWVAGTASVASAALLVAGPLLAGNVYYALRPDLLAVPLVAAGAVSLLFGVRALVAFVVPLLLATLTWPLPLRALLEPVADGLTRVTAGAVEAALHVLPLATPVDVPGDLRLSIAGPGGEFDVVVASACSGIAGITGTLLVGLAAQYVLHGPARARLAWLGAATALAWVLNLARILLLLGAGRLFGERVALDVVHPVAGLLLLNVSFALLVAAAPAFGLRPSLTRPVPADTPLTEPAPAELRMGSPTLARRVGAVAVGAALLATLDAEVPGTATAYEASEPAAVSFADAPDAPPGFVVTGAQPQPWARAYFGQDSAWTRYRLHPASTSTGFSLWLDTVSTSDWSALRAHPLLDCYSFHGFDLVDVRRPVLASGLLAEQVVYRHPDGATWHVLSWEWPVRGDDGLRHERVVLLASSQRDDLAPGTQSAEEGPGTGLRELLAARWGADLHGTDPNPSLAEALRRTADDLVARHLVAHAATADAGGAA